MSPYTCVHCGREFRTELGLSGHLCSHALNPNKPRPKHKRVEDMTNEEAFEADWSRKCQNCGEVPVVNATGLCGPCTFGEADTAGGNW